MTREIIKIIIKKCLGHKKGERLLIVCDDKFQVMAQAFYRTARREGIEVTLLQMAPRRMHGEEPPEEVTASLKTADMAILLTLMSLSHTRARKTACAKFGTRIASLPGITPAILKRSIKINYSSLKKKSEGLARRLTKGKSLELHTNKGTHLVMSIRNMRGFTDDGLYTKPGSFGNLPAGESCIAPCEGTTNGRLIVDASAPLVGKVKRPVELIIKDGLVQNMPFGKIASLIKPLGRAARNIAELGIGLNPKAQVTGNILEDEKAKHTAHLAIGANISFGGNVSCPCHLDFVFFNPCILIDGARLCV
ncbi:MAG: aminopeptidase [Candidatus Omnitrophota bacterium]|nr:MAG: aminopeptidase [Candidatus Omnitrophota bacterium]